MCSFVYGSHTAAQYSKDGLTSERYAKPLMSSVHLLRVVEWVDFKSTFLEKYKCHDQKTDILRSLVKFQFEYV